MIVIGYQGIGKSTLSLREAETEIPFIDLESGCFWNDGVRADDWYKSYVNVALDLARQGHNVFVSSHKQVREELLKSFRNDIYVCYPSKKLKQSWIMKLRDRYIFSTDEEKVKNYKAMMNAIDRYDANIDELANSGFPCIEIDSMDYCLGNLLREAEQTEIL